MGLYLGDSARTPIGETWNFDLWFIDEPERQPDPGHLANLLPRITDEHREAILSSKQELAARMREVAIPSVFVCEGVVDCGARDWAILSQWLESRSSST